MTNSKRPAEIISNHNLPEYGFVSFWNTANQHVVPDPFKVAK